MYVRNRMTKDPYTITSDASISDAVALMKEKKLKRVPVVDGDKVLGVLTQGDIQKVSPTQATSLSIFEINYLLSKLTVKDAMSKKLITIEADSLLEKAAVIMRENRIGTLPVVEDGKLVGIITESDIFEAFIHILGIKDKGSRITVEAEDVIGVIAEIAGIFSNLEVSISRIAVFGDGIIKEIVIRSNAMETTQLERELNAKGYKVKHISISE